MARRKAGFHLPEALQKLTEIADYASRLQADPIFPKGKMSGLQRAHWLARASLWGLGYRLDLRHQGDLKLGLWRKQLRKTASSAGASKSATPRRLVVLPGFGDTPLSWMGVLALLQPVLRRRFDEVVFF